MAARTTISLSESLMRRLRVYAQSRSLGLSQALEELIARGLEPDDASLGPARHGELTPFRLPGDSPRVTTARIRELENDPD